MSENVYDVAVVGNGLIGTSLALLLAQQNMRVVLIGATEFIAWNNQKRDLRVSSFNLGARELWRTLGVWEDILQCHAQVYRKMQVWDGVGGGEIQFSNLDVNVDALGYIVENNAVLSALHEKFKLYDNLLWICASPNRLEIHEEYSSIFLDTQKEIRSRLIVGADGAQSWVRKHNSMGVFTKDYQQQAIVAHLSCEIPHDETARQCFHATGPIAFLPLNQPHEVSLVWSTAEAKRLLEISTSEFCMELARAIGDRLGKIELMSERASWKLVSQHALRYVDSRIALIGDAAHVIHPLAGQGANLGLMDAACLSEILTRAFSKNQDLGSMKVLMRYDAWRRRYNQMISAAMTAFNTLFISEQKPLIWLRSRGLLMANAIKPLKKMFMTQALGLNRDLPSFVRPNRADW